MKRCHAAAEVNMFQEAKPKGVAGLVGGANNVELKHKHKG